MRAIFVASTGQHIGKTTLSLGLFSALRTRFSKVGYFKPVGQETCQLESGLLIDKDVELFRKTFNLTDPPQLMSPVVIPPGTTRQYLEGKVPVDQWKQTIKQSFLELCDRNDFVLCEGTGHVGVGSILGLDNAVVAQILETDVIIVSQAGLGRAIDQLHLNACVMSRRKCNIRGVILNQVKLSKKDMLSKYIPLALQQSPLLNQSRLLGLIPFDHSLAMPTLRGLCALFHTQLLGTTTTELSHLHAIKQLSLEVSLQKTYNKPTLFILSKCRDDLLKKLLVFQKKHPSHRNALILCGHSTVKAELLQELHQGNIPFLLVPERNDEAIKKIHAHISKISADDQDLVRRVISHVAAHLDLGSLFQEW